MSFFNLKKFGMISLLGLLGAEVASSAVVWDAKEAERDPKLAVFFDVGVEMSQGVRLEKNTVKDKTEYALSLVVGDKPKRRMPISKKVFYDRYQSLRNLVLESAAKGPVGECRIRYHVVKSSERNPAWETSLCAANLNAVQKAAIGAWYKKTLAIVETSGY